MLFNTLYFAVVNLLLSRFYSSIIAAIYTALDLNLRIKLCNSYAVYS